MFIAVLLTVADTSMQPSYSSTDEWMKKMCTYEKAVKKKKSETMPFAAMWMGHVERQLDDN